VHSLQLKIRDKSHSTRKKTRVSCAVLKIVNVCMRCHWLDRNWILVKLGFFEIMAAIRIFKICTGILVWFEFGSIPIFAIQFHSRSCPFTMVTSNSAIGILIFIYLFYYYY